MPFTEKTSGLQNLHVIGSSLSGDGLRTNLEKFLRIVELHVTSSTNQSNMILRTSRRHISPDVVSQFPDLVRKLSKEWDGIVQHAKISSTHIRFTFISLLEVPTTYDFI